MIEKNIAGRWLAAMRAGTSRSWRKSIPYVFSILAMLLFVAYLVPNSDRYRQLLDLAPGPLLLIVALVVLPDKGLLNFIMFRGLGVPLTFNESIGLSAVNTLANQLPFAGGIVARGTYLKQRYRFPYVRFLSATIALYVCTVSATGVLGLALMTYWALEKETVMQPALLIGFGLMASTIALLIIPVGTYSQQDGWRRWLSQLLDGKHALSRDLALTASLVTLQLLGVLVFAGRLWAAFQVASQEVSLANCFLLSAASILTQLVSFAPGGLGVREAIVAATASLLGFDAGISVVAVGIDRLVSTFTFALLGLVYTYILSRNVASAGTVVDVD